MLAEALLAELQKHYWLNYRAACRHGVETGTAGSAAPPPKAARQGRTAPKKALNPYLVFLRKHEARVRAENPEKTNTQITHTLAKMWKAVSDEERVRSLLLRNTSIADCLNHLQSMCNCQRWLGRWSWAKEPSSGCCHVCNAKVDDRLVGSHLEVEWVKRAGCACRRTARQWLIWTRGGMLMR